jgi:hypothetical protein
MVRCQVSNGRVRTETTVQGATMSPVSSAAVHESSAVLGLPVYLAPLELIADGCEVSHEHLNFGAPGGITEQHEADDLIGQPGVQSFVFFVQSSCASAGKADSAMIAALVQY